MKTFNVMLADYIDDETLRGDVKFHSGIAATGWNLFGVPLSGNVRLFDILYEDYNLCPYEDGDEYKGIPTGQAYLDEDGDIVDYLLVDSYNHPARLKYSATSDNLLISSLRLAKSPALNFEIPDIGEYVFSNGFYIFKVVDGWDKRFVLYILRSRKIKDFIDNNIYRGIGISAYMAADLLKIQIRNLPLAEQQKALDSITAIENKIKALKKEMRPEQFIIDDIIARNFKLYRKMINEIDDIKVVTAPLRELSFINSNLRNSVRWAKASLIQEKMLLMCDSFERLGKHILKTRNGFSPDCYEGASATSVLGLDSLNKNTVLNIDDTKYTDMVISSERDCYVKNGDFFISRGNTTDLVALASIATLAEDTEPIIFPDIMIRIDFGASVDKQYMAYIFNSFIGRLYFKYAAKGKNQTMVKVSSKELNDFYVPLPPLSEQRRIANEINLSIEKQNILKSQITALRIQIDDIIENTLTNGI